MTDTASRQWLTIVEAAERLNVDQRTVRRWIAKGELVPFRAGRVVRISADELERFIRRHCR